MTTFLQKLTFYTIVCLVLLAARCNSTTSTSKTLVGHWQDDKTDVSTIEKQGDQYVVVTVFDVWQTHSQNLLVSSSYSNGVLTWEYCPLAKPCLTMKTIAFHGDTLDVNWADSNGGSGTMTLKRVPTTTYTGQ
jgi:hypothetical protein